MKSPEEIAAPDDAPRELEMMREYPPITMVIDHISAALLISQLQLALRHPQNTGAASKTALEVASGLQSRFAGWPAACEMIEMGWDEDHDVALDEAKARVKDAIKEASDEDRLV